MRRLVVHNISVKDGDERTERAARNTAVEELHLAVCKVIFIILCDMADVFVTVSDTVARKNYTRALGKNSNIHILSPFALAKKSPKS